MPANQPVRTLGLALGANDFESALVAALTHTRTAGQLHRCVDVVDLSTRTHLQEFSAVLVEPTFPRLSGSVIERVAATGVRVLGLANTHDDAVRLGNWGVTAVVQVDSADIAATVAAIDRELATDKQAKRTAIKASAPTSRESATDSPLIAVWGAPGAPGRTIIATVLAQLLAANGEHTFLVDADTTSHGLAAHLAMQEEGSGLIAAAHHAEKGTLDVSTLARLARAITPNLRVLTGVPHIARRSEIRSSAMARVWQVAEQLSDVVVADVGHCVDDALTEGLATPGSGIEYFQRVTHVPALTALSRASTLVAVTSSEPGAMARMLSYLGPVRALDPSARLIVVVNRVRAPIIPNAAVRDEVREFVSTQTKAEQVIFVRDDRESCDQALTRGLTPHEYAPRGEFVTDLKSLALALAAPVWKAS